MDDISQMIHFSSDHLPRSPLQSAVLADLQPGLQSLNSTEKQNEIQMADMERVSKEKSFPGEAEGLCYKLVSTFLLLPEGNGLC